MAFGLANDSVEDFSAFKVDEIKITGAKRIEKEAILDRIETKIGKTVSQKDLRNIINNIYQMKSFEQVELYQIEENGKNILELKLQERPVLTEIVFEGQDGVKEDDLKAVLTQRKYSIVDINAIKSDVKAIQKLYEEKGFFLAQVSYRLEPLENDQLKLIYLIQEFDKVKVKTISFLGNRALSDQQIKDVLMTKEDSLFSFFSDSGAFKETNFERDVELIKYFYKTKGYLQINVARPEVTISEDKKWVFITMRLVEGPQFTVNNIKFSGDMLWTEQEFNERISLKENETYSEEVLQQDIRLLTEMYQDKGYAFVNVLRTLETIPGEDKVDVEFIFEKGKLAKFGKVFIKGNSKTRDKVVRRELEIEEGKRFSGSALRRSQENVNRLGFFEPGSVVFNSLTAPGTDDVIDIEISVKERNTGQISLGAGYSSNDKGFMQASVSQNNFLGRGQVISLDANFGSRIKNYSLAFTEPYLFDTLWTSGADVSYSEDKRLDDFELLTKGGSLKVGHPVFNNYTRLFLTYRIEDRKIRDAQEQLIDNTLENGLTSSMMLSMIQDLRNNSFEPTAGHYWRVSTRYAGLGGDRKWLKNEVETRFYKRVVGDLIFRNRIYAGRMDIINNERIPYSEKFALGGPRDLRGYLLNQIGPRSLRTISVDVRDNNGNIIGRENRRVFFNNRGLSSFFTTLEFEHPLAKEAGLKWVIFTDWGNVWEDSPMKENNFRLRGDYGFGFRWFSPIGVLRFEFGYPIKPRDDESGSQFNFDLGQIF